MASNAKAVMLADTYDPTQHDPTGWLVSEKLDGVRAYWSGSKFYSRQGNVYQSPEWFRKELPDIPLDGELWCGRGAFQKVVGYSKKKNPNDEEWDRIVFMVFDAPAMKTGYKNRWEFLQKQLKNLKHTSLVGIQPCKGRAHLQQLLETVTDEGGEGLMIRDPKSPYESGRSSYLLKVKRFHDEEAQVVDYMYKEGSKSIRHLECKFVNGQRFSVGTGFTEEERASPPKKGAIITIKYQELTQAGKPRFPAFLRERPDVTWQDVVENAKTKAPFSQGGKRAPVYPERLFQTENPKEDEHKELAKSTAGKGVKPICPKGKKCTETAKIHFDTYLHPFDISEKKGSSIEDPQDDPKEKNKPNCKYWDKCFQTNKAHLEAFHHPKKFSKESENFSKEFAKPSDLKSEQVEISLKQSEKSSKQECNSEAEGALTDSMSETEVEKALQQGLQVSDNDSDFLGNPQPLKGKSLADLDIPSDPESEDTSLPEKYIPVSPPTKPNSKPVCKYDVQGCTRKNPQHFIDFQHPNSGVQIKIIKKSKIEQVLKL